MKNDTNDFGITARRVLQGLHLWSEFFATDTEQLCAADGDILDVESLIEVAHKMPHVGLHTAADRCQMLMTSYEDAQNTAAGGTANSSTLH